jgi:hypothetical protein
MTYLLGARAPTQLTFTVTPGELDIILTALGLEEARWITRSLGLAADEVAQDVAARQALAVSQLTARLRAHRRRPGKARVGESYIHDYRTAASRRKPKP